MIDTEHIGLRIKAWRDFRGLSAAEVARRAHISRQQLSFIERGRTREPGVFLVQRLAHVFGLTIDALVAGLPMPLPHGHRGRERPRVLSHT